MQNKNYFLSTKDIFFVKNKIKKKYIYIQIILQFDKK